MYARRNHRLTQIMQLLMQDRKRAVYAFLRGDTPFCPPAGRIQQRAPWNPFAGLPGDLRATFQRAPLHALLVPRSCIAHEEAMSLFPQWMAAVAPVFSQWISSWAARDITAFREWSRVVSAQSSALVRGTMVRSPDGQSEPCAPGIRKPSSCGECHGLASRGAAGPSATSVQSPNPGAGCRT